MTRPSLKVYTEKHRVCWRFYCSCVVQVMSSVEQKNIRNGNSHSVCQHVIRNFDNEHEYWSEFQKDSASWSLMAVGMGVGNTLFRPCPWSSGWEMRYPRSSRLTEQRPSRAQNSRRRSCYSSSWLETFARYRMTNRTELITDSSEGQGQDCHARAYASNACCRMLGLQNLACCPEQLADSRGDRRCSGRALLTWSRYVVPPLLYSRLL